MGKTVNRITAQSLLVIPAIVLLHSGVMGEIPRSGNEKSSDKGKIAVQAKLSHDRVHAGSILKALLIVRIQEGWHINVAHPTEEELIGTSVDVKKTNVIDSVAIRFPNGIERHFDFSETALDVYEGTIKILLTLRIRDNVKAGSYTLPATIDYQACSNSVCLAPASVQIDIPILVAARNQLVHPTNKELFAPYTEQLK